MHFPVSKLIVINMGCDSIKSLNPHVNKAFMKCHCHVKLILVACSVSFWSNRDSWLCYGTALNAASNPTHYLIAFGINLVRLLYISLLPYFKHTFCVNNKINYWFRYSELPQYSNDSSNLTDKHLSKLVPLY